MAKQSKIQHKTHHFHRARKAPKCLLCGRTRKRDERRKAGGIKRRSAWTAKAKPCQFHKSYDE